VQVDIHVDFVFFKPSAEDGMLESRLFFVNGPRRSATSIFSLATSGSGRFISHRLRRCEPSPNEVSA